MMKSKAINPAAENSQGTRASLELLYNVSREFASALDLRTVLQRVLFLSMKTAAANSGSIIVLDDQGKAVESAIITGSEVHDHTTQRLRFTLDSGLAGWVVRNRQAVLIEDASKDSRWTTNPSVEAKDYSAAKAVVSAPLLVRERLVGVITLANQHSGYFTFDHLSLVQAIADQASIFVLNARLYAESQRQARVMTALAESAAAMNASLNLEDVLMRILEHIHHALRVEAVSLALVEPHGGRLVFRAAIGWKVQNQARSSLRLGQGITGWAAREGQSLIVQDAQSDPRFDPEIDDRTQISTRSIACAPIRSRLEVIGILEVINPLDEVFDPDALLVLNGIASLAGSAIHNAQLFESLEAAHKRYRDLFEDSIEPILITDWHGNILEANRQAIHTIQSEVSFLREMQIGQIHDLDQDKTGERFEGLAGGEAVSYESRLHTRAGMAIPVEVFVRQVTIENTPHLQWIIRDISERKNLDRLREDLMSMAYHDLRSPLANVIASMDAVESMITPGDNPDVKTLLGIARRSAERIERLTNSLLDISRLEAGQPVVNRRSVPVGPLIGDAIEVMGQSASSKNLRLTAVLPPDLPEVLGDPDMLRRILTNLLENAIKYTPTGGHIEVGASLENRQLRIWVRDTGSGIDPSEKEHIFEKFARLASHGSIQGLGLGLTFCRLAVEGHGGRIWVESQPGEGSQFIFTLPLA